MVYGCGWVAKLTSEQEKGSDWYCPDTDQIVYNPVRRFLFRRSGEGHRVVRFQDPPLSSDMAFLWGTYLGMMITAALLYASGYFVIHGPNRLLAGAGYGLLAIGFSFPLYWGVSMILLGRKCTKRKSDAPPSTTPPLSYRIGWVTAAKGAGIVTGTCTVLAVALFLMISGTASYIY